MTFLGLVGILLGFLALPFGSLHKTPKHVAIMLVLCLLHTSSAIYYYNWAQTNTTDSTLYYFDPYGFYGRGFSGGTGFVISLVQQMREMFGGSYLDYFLVFQASGVWAIATMKRIIDEAYNEVGQQPSLLLYVPLFVPTLHFFTSSIGKDGPLVLAAALMTWGAIDAKRRIIPIGIALWIMLLFRPHIALVGVSAFAVALVLDPATRLRIRLSLGALAVGAFAIAAGSVQTTFGLDLTSAESVGTFFERQADVAQEFDTGTAVLGASFPERLMSLLFRPFFYDAENLLAFIASIENIVMIVIFALFSLRYRELAGAFRSVFFVRFAAIFALTLALLLAYIYYNVGLGLRQRTMILPGLLASLAALLVIHKTQIRMKSMKDRLV